MNKRGIGIIALLLIGLVFGGVAIFMLDRFLSSDTSESAQVAEPISEPVIEELEEEVVEEPEETDEVIGELHGEDGEQQDPNITVEGPLEAEEGETIDLVAYNLTLENLGCSDANNTEGCEIGITGVIRNGGNSEITTDFTVHFYDAETSDFILIDSPPVNADLASGETAEVSVVYEDLSRDTYFVQFRVDATNMILEVNENNNIKNGFVEVYGSPA